MLPLRALRSRNVHVAAEDAHRKPAPLFWLSLSPTTSLIINYPTKFFCTLSALSQIVIQVASFSPSTASKSIVWRAGVQRNALKQTYQLRDAIDMSHIDKHPPGQKCQEFCWLNGTRWWTTRVDVHYNSTGSIPRLSFTTGSVIAFSGWCQLETPFGKWAPFRSRKKPWPEFAY